MTKTPAISIITPVWNGLPFIKECVESVIAQQFTDWEMLIGDNCSTDGTLEYLDSLADPRIKIFKHESNKGIFGNLNFLFSKAKSPVSQVLCADDYFIGATSLSKIVNYWGSAPSSVGIVIFNQNDPARRGLIALQKKVLPELVNTSQAALLFYCFGNIAGNLSNVSVLTAVVAQNGGFREDLPYSGDFEFWSRAATKVALAIQTEPVVYVRRHPGVASNYLNKNGEIIWQNTVVVNQLYSKLIQQFPKAKFAIRLHGTINYDTLQRYIAVKVLLLRGKKNNMNALGKAMKSALFSMSFLANWFVFIITAGGHIGRQNVARHLLGKCNFTGSNI